MPYPNLNHRGLTDVQIGEILTEFVQAGLRNVKPDDKNVELVVFSDRTSKRELRLKVSGRGDSIKILLTANASGDRSFLRNQFGNLAAEIAHSDVAHCTLESPRDRSTKDRGIAFKFGMNGITALDLHRQRALVVDRVRYVLNRFQDANYF